MEQITYDETIQQMVSELETTFGKLALCAEISISTSHLESKAQALASKIKLLNSVLGTVQIYKGIKGSQIYSWDIGEKIPSNLFSRYAKLCKDFRSSPEVYVQDEQYYVKLSEGVFVNLVDLPDIPLPTFKFKIEGDTLMAIRTDIFLALPDKYKKLIEGEKQDE